MKRLGPIALAALLAPLPAAAHGAAERYDLPLPLDYYVAGAGAVVALSFAAIGLLWKPERSSASAGATRRAPIELAGAFWPWLRLALGAIAVALFALAIAAGLFGNAHPGRNIAPTFVWVVWWVGFAFVAAFVGNFWPWIDPWRLLFAGAERIAARRFAPLRPYPRRWRHWPSFVLLATFSWFELISPFASDPRWLAGAAIAYSAITWLGMAVYGRDTWLRHGEMFSVYFDLLGRFAPLSLSAEGRGLRLRWWGGDLARPRPIAGALVAFLLLMLAAALFDGFLGTGLWRTIERWAAQRLPLNFDRHGFIAASLCLAGLWLVFLSAYRAAVWAAARLTGDGENGAALGQRFALTLLPIAIGYHVAHNLSYLLVQGQAIFRHASDPFGRGWNLFGTAGFEPDIGVIDARATWLIALVAITGGHVVSVFLAHRVALARFASPRLALRAMLPMTALMVLYTGLSLSILAEPLVRFSRPDPSYSLIPLPSDRG